MRLREATALSEIAMCRVGLGQKQRALDFLEKALPKWRQIGDSDDEASTRGKEGDIYQAWGFPEQALRNYKQALPLFVVAGDRAGRAAVLTTWGLHTLR
jgi:tetratricopeptide (TPR) repeat protein